MNTTPGGNSSQARSTAALVIQHSYKTYRARHARANRSLHVLEQNKWSDYEESECFERFRNAHRKHQITSLRLAVHKVLHGDNPLTLAKSTHAYMEERGYAVTNWTKALKHVVCACIVRTGLATLRSNRLREKAGKTILRFLRRLKIIRAARVLTKEMKLRRSKLDSMDEFHERMDFIVYQSTIDHATNKIGLFWTKLIPSRAMLKWKKVLKANQQMEETRNYAAGVIQRTFKNAPAKRIAQRRREIMNNRDTTDEKEEESMFQSALKTILTLQRFGQGYLGRKEVVFIRRVQEKAPILRKFFILAQASFTIRKLAREKRRLDKMEDIAEAVEFAEHRCQKALILQRIGRGLLDRKFTALTQMWKASSCTIQRWMRTKMRRKKILQQQKLDADLKERAVHLGGVQPREGTKHISCGTQLDPSWLDWLDAAPQRRTVYVQTVKQPQNLNLSKTLTTRIPITPGDLTPKYDTLPAVSPIMTKTVGKPTKSRPLPPISPNSTLSPFNDTTQPPATAVGGDPQSPKAKEELLRKLYYASVRNLSRLSLHGIQQVETLLSTGTLSDHDIDTLSETLSRTQAAIAKESTKLKPIKARRKY